MPMKEFVNHIKIHARRLGFDLVGIAQPHPSDHTAFYADWLSRGHHAQMGYLARPDAVRRRTDPRHVMAETRSIIAVGMNYYPGGFPPANRRVGRVSRYAWGADYHGVIRGRLQRLAEWIDGALGQRLTYRAHVDTGPLLEREIAQRAGLGWIGKNTNLIHPRVGSYFFLGELLLDVELAPDAPLTDDRCGSCTACLDACPTGALEAPRVLDARRCISYLTVEHRGAVPQAIRPLIADWIFGCDICQEVCPWNRRFADPTRDRALRPVHARLDPIEMLALDEGSFRSHFRETAVWRARRAGLLRNAAVVLGNVGDTTAIPALEGALSDPEPLVAGHAAWALSRLTGQAGRSTRGIARADHLQGENTPRHDPSD
jgi:epoxyqueuosine reductase